jgi:hypothetical protein
MDSKDRKILIFVVFLMIVAIGLGIVNSFFGSAVVDIEEINPDDPGEMVGGDSCTMDIDCPGSQVCFHPCGVCGDYGCNYDACEGGNSDACCEAGLTCNEWSSCVCAGTGGSCFVEETKISIVDGSKKNIEDVKIGDKVLSYNLEINKIEEDVVIGLKRIVHDDMIIVKFGNSENTNTFDHPYFVKEKGWSSYKPDLTMERYGRDTEELRDVKQLETGDVIFIVDEKGNLVESDVISIDEEIGIVHTYIFSVENNGNFFANGALVHNKGPIPAEQNCCHGCTDGFAEPCTVCW